MGTSGRRANIWRVLVAVVLVAACTGTSKVDRPGEEKVAEQPESGKAQTAADDEQPEEREGLEFAVSEAAPDRGDVEPPKRVQGTALTDAAITSLLGRVDSIAADPSDQQSFAFRSRSQPPPTTGETETTAFPPPEQRDRPSGAEAPDKGPLEIVRRAPEGDVEVAPRLSVSFSHPMVSIGSAGKVYEADRPVELRPEVEGTWRWVGTKTLLFEPEQGRFPMASRYEVSVPQATTSVDGVGLETSASWTFSTPPVRVEEIHPTGGPHGRRPLMFMAFDQRIERRAIIDHVKVWGGGDIYPTHLVAGERIEEDEQLARWAERTPDDQWIAFTVDESLPADTQFQIGLEQGAPSAEGDRRTQKGQYETFETYAPLTVEETGCRYRDCTPGAPWVVRFNNELDPASVDASTVRVRPSLPGKKVDVDHNRLVVRGESKGRRTYEIDLAQKIRDRYGQKLGASEPQTIEVGAAPAMVYGAGDRRVTLDPTGPRTFPVHAINYGAIEVTAHAVEPSDWTAYAESVHRRGDDWTPPGEKVFERRIEIEAGEDTFATTQVDLAEALDDGHGQVVLQVRGVDAQLPEDADVPTGNQQFDVWVQSTDIGLDAYKDRDDVVVWATDLATGKPMEDVEVSLTWSSETATTDADGVATLPLPGAEADDGKEGGQRLIAKKKGDLAFLPGDTVRGYRSWIETQPIDEGRWFVFDDRNLYRPGETVRLKGWLRLPEESELAMPEEGTEIGYTVAGPRDNEIASGTLSTDAHGGFDLAVDVPDDINLGRAYVTFRTKAAPKPYRYGFRIQEFRTPAFEVGVETDDAGPHVVGESVGATAEASYYAGGEVRGAEIDWTLQSSTTTYEPPGWSGFVFGEWQPWWYGASSAGTSHTETLEGRTDGSGRHRIAVDLEGVRPPEPQQLSVDASVTDIDRQTIAGSKQLLVHPSERYVGLKTDRWFVEADEPLEVEVVATRIDGTAVTDEQVTVRAERLEWRSRDGEWTEEVAETTTCTVTTAEKPVTCELELGQGGEWRISSTIEDERGRENRTRLRVWVPGGEQPTSEHLEREEVQLIPQKESWRPGETAEVLVQAPFAGGEGLAVVQRNGVEETIRFSMEGTSHTLELPIEAADIPNLHLRVDVNGSTARTTEGGEASDELPDRPAFASGDLELNVSRQSKALTVDVAPKSSEVAPGDEVEVAVEVTGSEGTPAAGSQVALVAVDEAVLAAADYKLGAPLEALYRRAERGVRSYHLRETVILATERQLEEAVGRSSGMGMVGAAEGAGGAPMMQAKQRMADSSGASGRSIELRKDFRPLAHFAPALETGENGRATATFTLPDNLTRYRLMAVAVDGAEKIGAGESQVTARLPLMVQPAMPRFLNWGDKADLPVVVRNQTDEPRTVELAARSSNLALTQGRGFQFEVPAGDRVELQFPSETESPGTARLQFVAASGDWADAAEVDFPVWTPATTQAFADYGVLDEGATSRRIEVPDQAVGEFGSLEVTTSSTALEQLTDAFIYLVDYPYEGSEQIASRLLSVSALRDVLGAFDAEGLPEGDKLDAMVERDLERLAGLQQSDGGFSLWGRSGRSWPFVSVHATHALALAEARGFEIPEGTLERAERYLREIDGEFPDGWSEKLRNTVRAYALYVRQMLGSVEPATVEKLAGKELGKSLSLEGAGWVLSTLAEMSSGGNAQTTLREAILDRAIEEAGTAQFAADYANDRGYLVMHSDRRADALVLDALLRTSPNSSLIPKVVEGLMAHRTKGRWGNTQENVFVLLALQRYFETFEKEAPDFAARMWLGDQYVGEHAYRERTTTQRRVEIPLDKAREVTGASGESGADFTISREGDGRLYYRIGMTYAPRSRQLAPLERGFAVERTYEAVDEDSEVQRREDGTWVVEAGARVRVRVRMVAPARRHHVALVDPLAGGFESLNPAIATTEPIPADPADSNGGGAIWWWDRPWFEHQNLRDERTEAFASTVAGGVHTYSYVVRATTPGEFVVPPPKAEELYHPETFGRGATDRVVIK